MTALELLEKAYGRIRLCKDETLLERFMYLVVQDGSPLTKATKAMEELNEAFVDWNEVRVTKPYEVRGALKAINDSRVGGKADVIVATLKRIYDDRSKLNFDFLAKVEPAARRKALGELIGVPAWIQAAMLVLVEGKVSEQPDALRVARRIGLVDKKLTPAKARAKLATLFPADEDFVQAIGLLVQHASRFCPPKSPKCIECFLKKTCKEGSSNLSKAEIEKPAPESLLTKAVRNRPPMVVPHERPKEFVLPKVTPPPGATAKKKGRGISPIPKGHRGGASHVPD